MEPGALSYNGSAHRLPGSHVLRNLCSERVRIAAMSCSTNDGKAIFDMLRALVLRSNTSSTSADDHDATTYKGSIN
jgi:hypothetical protein